MTSLTPPIEPSSPSFPSSSSPATSTPTIATLKNQLLQLRQLHEAGALTAAQHDEARGPLERQLLEQVLTGADVAEPIVASKVASPDRLSSRMAVVLGAVVLAVAGAGYWWAGALSAASQVDVRAFDKPAGSSADAPHPTSADQIEAMTEKLAQRLKAQPDDAEGWAMLARSYTVLERHPEALHAYGQAVTLRADDGQLLADYADSLAVKNKRSLIGEPMTWVEKALRIEPKNLKALSLAGAHAFETKNYAGAVKYWDQVVLIGPADSSYVKQVQTSLVEARQLAGLPAATPAAASKPALDKGASGSATAALATLESLGPRASLASPAWSTSAASSTSSVSSVPSVPSASVSGVVTLAASLASRASPDDTVFVLARTPDGKGMPLAILRKQVKDLPIAFTLDDSQAMSPAAKISGAPSVIVSARISKSGQALPQIGDMSGQTEPVNLGTRALKLEIRELVKQ